MGVNLAKGNRVPLQKNGEGPKFKIGLGWNIKRGDGQDFDLDVSAFALDPDGKGADDRMAFYNATSILDGGVVHSGDNRTGAGDGDDELISIDLSKIDSTRYPRISIVITIDQATARNQNFGQIESAYSRVLDESGTELYKYDLSEDFSTATALIACEIYYNSGEWKFKAVGDGFNGGLAAICNSYGISV